MRSVCGCIPASSAATEITYTAVVRFRAVMAFPPAARSPVGSRVHGSRGGQLFDGHPLFIGQLRGNINLDGDDQVAGCRAVPLGADGDALALDAVARPARGARPEAQRHGGAVDRGHVDVAAE